MIYKLLMKTENVLEINESNQILKKHTLFVEHGVH